MDEFYTRPCAGPFFYFCVLPGDNLWEFLLLSSASIIWFWLELIVNRTRSGLGLHQPSPALAASLLRAPGTLPALSSYVNAFKLSGCRTEQPTWKEQKSRARNACKNQALMHLFVQTEISSPLIDNSAGSKTPLQGPNHSARTTLNVKH